MKKNMSVSDRIIRLLIAAIFVSLYGTGLVPGLGGIVVISLAAILLLTSLVNFCPLYFGLGLSTLRKKEDIKN